MRRNVAAELAEGFEALAVNRLSQRALPPPEVESMTPPSDLAGAPGHALTAHEAQVVGKALRPTAPGPHRRVRPPIHGNTRLPDPSGTMGKSPLRSGHDTLRPTQAMARPSRVRASAPSSAPPPCEVLSLTRINARRVMRHAPGSGPDHVMRPSRPRHLGSRAPTSRPAGESGFARFRPHLPRPR